MPTDVSPHEFTPFRWWDRLLSGGRCRSCYVPRWLHPVGWWSTARPLGGKKRAAPEAREEKHG